MKNLILLLLLTGCTTTEVPYAVVTQPFTGQQVQKFEGALANSQIQASQFNQYVSGIYGPNNNVSQVLLDYQQANRNLSALIHNPWNGYFSMRNLWLR